jgi:Tol biopolymer transport system component
MVTLAATALAVACGGSSAAPGGSATRLAFSSDAGGHPEIFVLPGEGGTARRVTRSSGSNKLPVFAPDGRSLIFVSDRTGNYELWRVRVDGSGLKRLTRGLDVGTAQWSPGGRRIAVSSYGFASYELYTIRPDGTGKKVLAKALSNEVQPAWSPDGRRIVYVRTCEVPEKCMDFPTTRRDRDGELYVVGADGGPQRPLARTPAVESDPRWSPNGRAIVFVSSTQSGSNIAVIKPDGTDLGQLTASRSDSDPQWSPDGRRIAFTSVRDGNSEIYVMNADGSGERNLTRNAGEDAQPRWSPDGRRIFFLSSREGDPKPFAMNADGSSPRRLAAIVAPYADLAVTPTRP